MSTSYPKPPRNQTLLMYVHVCICKYAFWYVCRHARVYKRVYIDMNTNTPYDSYHTVLQQKPSQLEIFEEAKASQQPKPGPNYTRTTRNPRLHAPGILNLAVCRVYTEKLCALHYFCPLNL